jgi:hypothetical protein
MITTKKEGDRLTITCPWQPGLNEITLSAFFDFLHQVDAGKLQQLLHNMEGHAKERDPDGALQLWQEEYDMLQFLYTFLARIRPDRL